MLTGVKRALAGKEAAPAPTPEYVLANRKGGVGAGAAGGLAQMQGSTDLSLFDAKTDKASAESYFHYYSCIMHQQVCPGLGPTLQNGMRTDWIGKHLALSLDSYHPCLLCVCRVQF